MKAIILAAGVGSRLKEFTNGNPKCLLEIGGETLLGREIRMLKELGFQKQDIIVVAGYKSEMLENCGADVIINDKYDIYDNSYSLGLALEKIATEDVIVMDADLFFDRQILEDALNIEEKNIVLSQISPDQQESTGIVIRSNGTISAIGKQYSNTGYVYISIFKIGNECIREFANRLLQSRDVRTWYTTALTEIMNSTPFYNHVIQHRWHEVDFVEDYFATMKLFDIASQE